MTCRKDFKFVFSFVLLLCLVSYLINCYVNRNTDIANIMSADFQYIGSSYSNMWRIFSVVFPFIIVFPFGFSYSQDSILKNASFVERRFGKSNYIVSKYIVSFIGGFIIIFIPFLINMLLNYLTFPVNMNNPEGTQALADLTGTNVGRDTVQAGKPFLQINICCR